MGPLDPNVALLLRAAQIASGKPQPHFTSPGGTPGRLGYVISPDAADRMRQAYRALLAQRRIAAERGVLKHPRGLAPSNYPPWDDRPRNV